MDETMDATMTTKTGTTRRTTAVGRKPASKQMASTNAVAKTRVAKKAAAKNPRSAAASRSRDTTSAAERIDRRIASLGDWRGERLAALRALIHEVDPDVVEDWKWMGTPVWSHDGMYVLANAHKDKVKITFFHGAKLADPEKLFNAGLNGGKWRAIDLREDDAIDRPALAALLREAIAYNATHAVPKSRGSRGARAEPKAGKLRGTPHR